MHQGSGNARGHVVPWEVLQGPEALVHRGGKERVRQSSASLRKVARLENHEAGGARR